MAKNLKYEVNIPENIECNIEGHMLKIKGPNGELIKKFAHPKIKLSINDKKILLECKNSRKREKTYAGTFLAHIQNMIKGLSKEFEYKLKICSGHFPMHVSVDHEKVIIKNFLGEKVPRIAKLLPGVKVSVVGDEIIVKGINKEEVGQSAANIEMITRITNRDRRVFQDGIFITSKGE